jgi:HSP20 family protein
MLLTRYKNPLEIQRRCKDEFDKLFEGVFKGSDILPGSLYSLSLKADIEESANEYIINVELPGVEKKDIRLNVENNALMIKGEKKQTKEVKENDYLCCERSYGSFQRSFKFPGIVKADEIVAEFKDGILRITAPKSEEVKRKEIEIKVK